MWGGCVHMQQGVFVLGNERQKKQPFWPFKRIRIQREGQIRFHPFLRSERTHQTNRRSARRKGTAERTINHQKAPVHKRNLPPEKKKARREKAFLYMTLARLLCSFFFISRHAFPTFQRTRQSHHTNAQAPSTYSSAAASPSSSSPSPSSSSPPSSSSSSSKSADM